MAEEEEQLNTRNIYSSEEFPLIPQDAFLYFPNEEESQFGKDTAGIRRIFEGQIEFNDFECDQLDSFDEFVEGQQKLELSQWWDDPKKLRFLYANKFNQQKAIDSMEVHQNWRKEKLPPKPSQEAMDLLNQGAMYLHGHDNRFRPIIALDISKLKSDVSLDVITDGMTFFFEYLIQNVFLYGQIENWIVILDLKNYGATQLPVKNIKGLMSYLSNNYRSRMYKCYIVNSAWTITGVWTMVKQFLTQNTIDKIIFEKAIPTGIFTHCNKNQVEEQYGGSAPTKESGFWPPQKISNEYLLPEDDKNKILVTKDKYVEMVDRKILNFNKVCLEILNEAENHKIEYNFAKEPEVKESAFANESNIQHAKNFRSGALVITKIQKDKSQKFQVQNQDKYYK